MLVDCTRNGMIFESSRGIHPRVRLSREINCVLHAAMQLTTDFHRSSARIQQLEKLAATRMDPQSRSSIISLALRKFFIAERNVVVIFYRGRSQSFVQNAVHDGGDLSRANKRRFLTSYFRVRALFSAYTRNRRPLGPVFFLIRLETAAVPLIHRAP